VFVNLCILKNSFMHLDLHSSALWQQQFAQFHLTMATFVIEMSRSNVIDGSGGSEGNVVLLSGVFLSC